MTSPCGSRRTASPSRPPPGGRAAVEPRRSRPSRPRRAGGSASRRADPRPAAPAATAAPPPHRTTSARSQLPSAAATAAEARLHLQPVPDRLPAARTCGPAEAARRRRGQRLRAPRSRRARRRRRSEPRRARSRGRPRGQLGSANARLRAPPARIAAARLAAPLGGRGRSRGRGHPSRALGPRKSPARSSRCASLRVASRRRARRPSARLPRAADRAPLDAAALRQRRRRRSSRSARPSASSRRRRRARPRTRSRLRDRLGQNLPRGRRASAAAARVSSAIRAAVARRGADLGREPGLAQPERRSALRAASSRVRRARARAPAGHRRRVATDIVRSSPAARPAPVGSRRARAARRPRRVAPAGGLVPARVRRERSARSASSSPAVSRVACCSACCGEPARLRPQLGEHVVDAREVRLGLGQLLLGLRRRRSWRRTPATSSNSGRRSSGRSASAWSTMPWPMNRNALSARLAASSRSTRSRSRIRWRLSRYSFSPERYSRRPSSTTPKSTGSSPSRVVDDERHVGHADRAGASRAGEDHVLGPARAQRPALLAQRPAQRVGEVALAAAVGPDDGADPGPELDVGALGERLEALDPQAEQPGGRAHAASPTRCPTSGASAAPVGFSGRSALPGAVERFERLGGGGGLGQPPRRAPPRPRTRPSTATSIRNASRDPAPRHPAAGTRAGRRCALGVLLEPALRALER